jgi:hypothetical protein
MSGCSSLSILRRAEMAEGRTTALLARLVARHQHLLELPTLAAAGAVPADRAGVLATIAEFAVNAAAKVADGDLELGVTRALVALTLGPIKGADLIRRDHESLSGRDLGASAAPGLPIDPDSLSPLGAGGGTPLFRLHPTVLVSLGGDG